MKKLLMGFGLSAMLTLGLVGCSEEASDTSTDTKVEAESSAPAKESKSTPEAEYAAYYTPLLADFSSNMAEFSDLLVGVDESDLSSRGTWYAQVMGKTEELNRIMADMRDYDGEVPDGIDHDALMSALDEYQHIPDDLPPAIESMYDSGGTAGITEMNEVTQHILTGNDHLADFTSSYTLQ